MSEGINFSDELGRQVELWCRVTHWLLTSLRFCNFLLSHSSLMLLLSHTSILSLITFIILPLPQFAPSPDLCYSATRNVHMCFCMHTYMCVLAACVCNHFSCATVLLPLHSPSALMLGAMYCTCTCDKDRYTTHLRCTGSCNILVARWAHYHYTSQVPASRARVLSGRNWWHTLDRHKRVMGDKRSWPVSVTRMAKALC